EPRTGPAQHGQLPVLDVVGRLGDLGQRALRSGISPSTQAAGLGDIEPTAPPHEKSSGAPRIPSNRGFRYG
ncbi:hypothetical protein, partial [Streptomyces shenzhenensis]|uniref:hypothetical protein n=1 Tax=Streptomyces shenzhenensis TaxID=943815 RepID=UPI0033F5AAC0